MQKLNIKITSKFAALILVVAMVIPVLAGCADFFFERQDQKDREQIVASIPVAAQKLDEVRAYDGTVVYPEIEYYTARTIEIKKGTLIGEFNQKGPDLIQGGMSVQDAVEQFLDDLINTEIVNAYIDMQFAQGLATQDRPQKYRQGVEWSPPIRDDKGNAIVGANAGTNFVNYNTVLKQVYEALQSEVFRVGNDILQQRGEEQRPSVSQPDRPTPPNPTPEQEKPDKPIERELWQSSYYPGDNIDDHYASLDKAAFRSVLNSFEKNLDLDFRLDSQQRTTQKEQLKVLQDLIRDDKYDIAYRQLGEDLYNAMQDGHPGNSVVYWIIGQTAIRETQESVFREQQDEETEQGITSVQIQNRYNELLASQKAKYDSDPSSFNTIADSSDLILYEPVNNLFWVKHILLQFSDEQTTALNIIRDNSPNKESYERLRDQLATQIKVKAKVNGYEVGKELSPVQIFDEIQGAMNSLEGHSFEANQKFDDLIYKYNADPGIFGNLHRGYLVQPNRNNDALPHEDDYGLDLQWVVEFAREAKQLRDGYDSGQRGLGAISPMVVTDNGIHILYLSDVTSGNPGHAKTYGIDEYTTAAKSQTVRQAIKELLANEQKTNSFEQFRMRTINTHRNSTDIEKFVSRYKDIWDR